MPIARRRLKRLEDQFAVSTKYGIDAESLPMSDLLNFMEEGIVAFGLSTTEAKFQVDNLRNEPWVIHADNDQGPIRYRTKPSEFTHYSDEELIAGFQKLAEQLGIDLRADNSQ